MVKLLGSFLRDNCGSSSAEYALILALLGSGIAGAAFAMGGAISEAVQATVISMTG